MWKEIFITNKILEKSYKFSLNIIKLVNSLPKNRASEVTGYQLLKSGTSIGANVEEAQAGYSKSDFTNKMNIAQKEARESNYWLRLLRDSELFRIQNIETIIIESNETVKMLYAIVKTSKKNT